jgi:hypothetical protein
LKSLLNYLAISIRLDRVKLPAVILQKYTPGESGWPRSFTPFHVAEYSPGSFLSLTSVTRDLPVMSYTLSDTWQGSWIEYAIRVFKSKGFGEF